MSIKSWDSLKKILKVKILQCQDYVNINDLISRILLSLWHYKYANDVSFFNLYYEDKFFSFNLALKYTDKNIIFWNVYIFIDRVKNVIESQEWKIIKNNFFTCLKKQALI